MSLKKLFLPLTLVGFAAIPFSIVFGNAYIAGKHSGDLHWISRKNGSEENPLPIPPRNQTRARHSIKYWIYVTGLTQGNYWDVANVFAKVYSQGNTRVLGRHRSRHISWSSDILTYDYDDGEGTAFINIEFRNDRKWWPDNNVGWTQFYPENMLTPNTYVQSSVWENENRCNGLARLYITEVRRSLVTSPENSEV